MDFIQLSLLLRDSLASKNSVSLPGIGTFCAEDAPASFSDRGYTINPPYRKLSFISAGDKQPDSGDVLVADGLEDCIAELCAAIKRDRSVVLDGLGKLRMTSKGDVFFVSDPDPDIFPDGFGLESVSMKAHAVVDGDSQPSQEMPAPEDPAQAVPAPETPAETPATEVAAEPSKKRKHGFLRFVLWLVAVLAIAAAAFRLAAVLAPDFIDSILYSPEELQLLGK